MATRNNTNEAFDKAADAGKTAADEAARTARTVADEASRAGEQAARAGADIARRGAETLRDNVQTATDTAAQTFQRTTDQFLNAFSFSGPRSEELVRQSSQNMNAVSEASTVLARGFQEVSHEWIGLVQDQASKNVDALNRLVGCRSVQDLVTVQSDLVRDNLRQAIDTGRRVAEVSLRVAEEAADIIQGQANSNANRARRAA